MLVDWLTKIAFIVLLMGLLFALGGTVIYLKRLQAVVEEAPSLNNPELQTRSHSAIHDSKVTVIIPAYNEAANIRACVLSVLQSSDLTAEHLNVWVVDDQSSDGTLEIGRSLQTEFNDPRFHVLAGQPRPVQGVWMGKNWACHQAVQQATGDYLLFLDADVRLKPGAIETAIAEMERQQLDLLTCWPTIVCGCLAEWLAQPLIVGTLTTGLPFSKVNDPKSETVFAVGPFMLFRRTAYQQIGGHQAVAGQVVEDVELARRIKQYGLKFYYALGHELASVRMYQTSAALWEGWTKNWYLGSQCNLSLTLYGAFLIFWICALPFLGLCLFGLRSTMTGFDWLSAGGVTIAAITIMLQFPFRLAIQRISAIPPNYWWLTGIGGIFVTAIMLASIVKTETGWGWTWRGRPLQRPVS